MVPRPEGFHDIVARRPGECHDCGRRIEAGDEVLWMAGPPEILLHRHKRQCLSQGEVSRGHAGHGIVRRREARQGQLTFDDVEKEAG